MKLRYIALYIDYGSGYDHLFRDNFNLNSRFISNYLSVQVGKLKFNTDGSFNMIAIEPRKDIRNVCRIVGEKALKVEVLFDKIAYEKMIETERYEYYLKLLEEGYKVCDQHKKIPFEQLLKIHQNFRDNGYKNEWLHKKKKFKEHGIEVALNCFFTTIDFQLRMKVYDLKSKTELVSDTVIRTLPNEVCFAHFFKDIIIENNELIITEFQDRPKIKFFLTDILKGRFSFKITNEGVEYKPYTN
jgi:hypothetical protein